MAADIRISTDLLDHPKLQKLERRLGGDQALRSLLCLWAWVAENKWDGDLEGLSEEDIELAARWRGSDGVLVRALSEVRLLDGEPGHYRVHDWADHNPWAAGYGARVAAAKKAANARWMRTACAPHAHRMRSAMRMGNAPNPTQPNPTQKPGSKPTPKTSNAVALPEWVPAEAWNGFLEMRARKKVPATGRAISLILKHLEQLRADGHDPGLVLDQSTERGWKGVFPLNGRCNGNGDQRSNRDRQFAEHQRAKQILSGTGA